MTTGSTAEAKFDSERAAEYERQSRIALAGYDACHELAACMLATSIEPNSTAEILVVGAGGTASEIITCGRLEPRWKFTAVDPSQPMLDLAQQRVASAGLAERSTSKLGYVDDLMEDRAFDAATLIGVLHHLPGDEAKKKILRSIARRLKPGAPFILACNQYSYADQPLLLAAWRERWRMFGATAVEVQAKLGKIQQGADPPHSETAVLALLANAGFVRPTRFFSSLFWSAWLSYCEPRSAESD